MADLSSAKLEMPLNWQTCLNMKHADGTSGKPTCCPMQPCCDAWLLHFTIISANALIHHASQKMAGSSTGYRRGGDLLLLLHVVLLQL